MLRLPRRGRRALVGKNIMGSGFDVEIWTHRGAGAYICGEETGLLESLEGKRAYPRNRPPFPAIQGAFGSPTVVNNVETLSNIPHIINRGADWYKSIGPEKSPGPEAVLPLGSRQASPACMSCRWAFR